MVSSTPRPHFTPGKDPVPILQEAGWARGPVWTGGKSRPRRDSFPDSPACSQSPYRLRYPAYEVRSEIYFKHKNSCMEKVTQREKRQAVYVRKALAVPLLLWKHSNTFLYCCCWLTRSCQRNKCVQYCHGNAKTDSL